MPPAASVNQLKVPFGTVKSSRLRNGSFHRREDAFEVEFEDGLSFLEPHRSIRHANGIAVGAVPSSGELKLDTRSGFFVHYDNGQTAEVSWAIICESPPKKNKNPAMKTSTRNILVALALG